MLGKLLGVRIFDLEVSSRCNLRCRFCPRDEMPEKGFMARATFERFLEQVRLRGTDSLAFVGMGEPTLNPELPAFIRRAKEKYPSVITWVTSNGTRLTEAVVGSLLDAGLDILDVSFNGTDPESYEGMMCGAHFGETLANLELARAAIERRGSRTRLQINFVVTAENQSRVEEIKAFWRARGIGQFRPQGMHNRGGTVAVEGMRNVDEPGLGGRSCSLFETVAFVSWTGEVYYCCHDIRRRHPLGNINTDTWREIQRRKRTIRQTQRWPKMCGACTDPLRHDMGAQIDEQIMTEAAGRVMGALRKIFGRPRIGPGRLQGRPGSGVGEPLEGRLSVVPEEQGGAMFRV